MMILNILIGLFGLGAVIFVHELGHLVAAKLVGIDVEAFSLGWGRKLVGFTRGGTEYRISVFPIGGFCKMKGERSYATALENDEDSIPQEPGSYFAAAPWKRIVALLAGPFANILFAIAVVSIVWGIGFQFETFPNRIILASDYLELQEPTPADIAGLKTGDVITSLGGEAVTSYADVQQMIAQNALEPLRAEITRDGQRLSLTVTPALTKETGAGYLGVYSWVEPTIESVLPDSPAEAAGFQSGDRIVSVNGVPVQHTLDFGVELDKSGSPAAVQVSRSGSLLGLQVSPNQEDQTIGVAFRTTTVRTPRLGLLGAIAKGTTETVKTLAISVRSLRLLFQGVELTSAVAGPVRISYYIGDVATSGFAIGFGEGLRSLSNFLALLSTVLFFMNLLPIPVLDGGQIILALLEWIRRRPPRPRSIYRYQLVGSVVIVALLFFALFGDILFLAGR
ncbi:MAG: PDZ domain-containing protein [Spirochaetales bacterium]|nr:MAG: PDZ domain-containing protein [Spirochaetales bacterium]